MNSRIELVDKGNVRIKRYGECTAQCTELRVTQSGLVNLECPRGLVSQSFDAEGRAALRDCLNCFDQTGSFAALADTSDVPYSGKRVRLKDHNGEVLGFIIRQRDDRKGFYYFRDDHKDMFVYSTTDGITILPLTPAPPKRVRAYTPVEAVEHLGREVLYQNRYYYLAMVGEHHVELSSRDDGIIPKIMHEQFAKVATWRDGSPCGIIEEAT